jgi:hypothetical protein
LWATAFSQAPRVPQGPGLLANQNLQGALQHLEVLVVSLVVVRRVTVTGADFELYKRVLAILSSLVFRKVA